MNLSSLRSVRFILTKVAKPVGSVEAPSEPSTLDIDESAGHADTFDEEEEVN